MALSAQFGFFLDFQLTSGNRGGNQAIFPPKSVQVTLNRR